VRCTARRFACAAAALGLAAAGCGSAPDDLFAIQRYGTIPGARLSLVVSDSGQVHCNGRRAQLTEPELLTARQLQRDLILPATQGLRLTPGPQSILSYSVKASAGTLHFSDSSPGQPTVLQRVAAFTREVARGPCRLKR